MKLNIWLYDDNGSSCASFYSNIDTIESLLVYLNNISENGHYTYTICNGDNSRVRKKNQCGKYNPPVLYRCMSCGAAIRKNDKYHKLHIKGQVYIFCTLCVELSDHIAYEREDLK